MNEKEIKLKMISGLLEGEKIRYIWDEDNYEYYFSIIDIIKHLTNTNNPKKYWKNLKKRMIDEECNLPEQIEKRAFSNNHLEDVCTTSELFRIVQMIPGKKAEKIKNWLAELARQSIDDMYDPTMKFDEIIDEYLPNNLFGKIEGKIIKFLSGTDDDD